MNALEAKDVRRSYGRQVVLDGFSLSVGAGEFAALMGPSGSGKSTFLHVAAGLIRADSGSVLVGGEEVTKMGDSAAAKFRRRRSRLLPIRATMGLLRLTTTSFRSDRSAMIKGGHTHV